MSEQERRPGHSKLVYDKERRTIVSAGPGEAEARTQAFADEFKRLAAIQAQADEDCGIWKEDAKWLPALFSKRGERIDSLYKELSQRNERSASLMAELTQRDQELSTMTNDYLRRHKEAADLFLMVGELQAEVTKLKGKVEQQP